MSVVKYQINDYSIECYEAGCEHKRTIVFAHGLGSNYRQWLKQIEYFRSSFHVIAFSLQGHGESSDNSLNEYSIEDYTKTAVELLEHLKVKTCIWVGNSMGGVIGYSILNQNKDLINHLITNGTTPEIIMSKPLLKVIEVMDRTLIKLMGFQGYIKFAAKKLDKV